VQTFSIIIPVKPGGYVAACDHLKTILPDDLSYEILLAEGCAPSQQRNSAAREAEGDLLYFLDDDSLIAPDNLALCLNGMSDPNIAVVGGPSITPTSDSWLQRLFGSALASAFGSGAVMNRYRATGETRKTTDKELILCNLAVRRSVFISLDGFNERLYPNEENEFLERVTAAGFSILHVPSMFVYRSQRATLKTFIRQMFSYGRGRGQQTLITSSFSITSFIPLFFIVYLILIPFFTKYVLLFTPLVIYLTAALVSTISVLRQSRQPFSLLLIGVYPLMHIVNGVGLFWGLINGKPDPVQDSSIRIRRIKRMGNKDFDVQAQNVC
jgi:GT2 family glycosyltransferase